MKTKLLAIALVIAMLAMTLVACNMSQEEKKKEITKDGLVYCLLENGTYGVKAADPANVGETVEIPAKIEGKAVTQILAQAFEGAANLKSISMPDSITVIGDYAFYNCTNLESITMPAKLKTIGQEAFHSCDSLTSVTIPEGVKSIGQWAFIWCTGLTSINIPQSVTGIGYRAFQDCRGLKRFVVDPDNPNYSSADGNLYNKDGTTLIQYALGKTNDLLVIPDGVTHINEYAVYCCDNFMGIIIPKSLVSIGEKAFEGCGKIEAVYYCGTVTDWDQVSIAVDNDDLIYNDDFMNTNLCFYSQNQPTDTEHSYWHYDSNGVPVIWGGTDN